jgi:hypothetical protein
MHENRRAVGKRYLLSPAQKPDPHRGRKPLREEDDREENHQWNAKVLRPVGFGAKHRLADDQVESGKAEREAQKESDRRPLQHGPEFPAILRAGQGVADDVVREPLGAGCQVEPPAPSRDLFQ